MDQVELAQVGQINLTYGLDISRFDRVVGLWSWYVSSGHSIATKFMESYRFKGLERTRTHTPISALFHPSSFSTAPHLRGCFPYPAMSSLVVWLPLTWSVADVT